MQLYYTFKRPNGQPLKDYSKTQTWSSDFPTSVTLVEMKESLGLWHSLDPSNLTMFNSYRSSITDDEGDFTVLDNCAEFPLIVEIESQQAQYCLSCANNSDNLWANVAGPSRESSDDQLIAALRNRVSELESELELIYAPSSIPYLLNPVPTELYSSSISTSHRTNSYLGAKDVAKEEEDPSTAKKSKRGGNFDLVERYQIAKKKTAFEQIDLLERLLGDATIPASDEEWTTGGRSWVREARITLSCFKVCCGEDMGKFIGVYGSSAGKINLSNFKVPEPEVPS
jgi:hypothetical protein